MQMEHGEVEGARTSLKGYQLIERLGQGGFGVVYRATQLSVGREVAIKSILPVHANTREFIQHFENEAQLVARLEHPHIVPLFDYWRDPYGAYLVMRYLRAGSLRDRMHKGRLPSDQILTILDHIASALDLAHRNGVVHNDVKPENILLDGDQNAYLSDFGIAEEYSAYINTGIRGSPGYMAPEQIQQERPSPLMDIYSLGIVLYELVAGVHPFASQTPSEMIMSHLANDFPPITDAAEQVNRVVLQAVSKNPRARQPTAMALFEDFQLAVDGKRSSNVALRSTVVNPYRGLRSFSEADAAIFFGRERLVQRLIARLQEEHPLRNFLAVVGPSGSGKSSVVSAGLVAAIRRGAIRNASEATLFGGSLNLQSMETWEPSASLKSEFIVQTVPGSHPLKTFRPDCWALQASRCTTWRRASRATPRRYSMRCAILAEQRCWWSTNSKRSSRSPSPSGSARAFLICCASR